MNNIYDKALKSQEKINSFITIVEPIINDNNGKLNNLYYAAKDNFCTKDILTTASSNILSNYIPKYNATVIDKLEQNGAILIGKTSMDELGMGGTNLNAINGSTSNPYDLTRMTGGSSGGSAAVVSANIVDLALGTDTGDSIRKPAGFTGTIGVKPTYGRISRYGVIPYASSLDHVGYFTHNVELSAKVLEVIAGRDDKDFTSSFKEVLEYSKHLTKDLTNKKIGILKNVTNLMKDPDLVKAFNKLVQDLKDKGATIIDINLDNNLLKSILPTYLIIANCEASANHSNLDGLRFGDQKPGQSMEEIMMNSRTEGLSYNVRKRFIFGSYGLFEENQQDVFVKAQKVRRLINDKYLEQLKDLDAILAPSSLNIAPLKDAKTTIDDELTDEYLIGENHLVISNFTGCPSMTLPLCYSNNMPMGINITSNHFDEQNMFNIALAIEELTGLKEKRAWD